MKGPLQSWTIIIFCYNEKDSVRKVNEAVQKVLSRISNGKREVVIVDDGSRDGSAQVIREIAKKYRNVRAVYHPVNRGIGEALRSGYRASRYENVCAVPADGQFDCQELLPFKFVEDRTFVSFCRKVQVGYSFFRRALSAANRIINRVLMGIRMEDVNWVKIYKLRELSRLDLRLHSSLVESEICAKLFLRGNRCLQTPSIYHQRTSGRARGASLKILWKAFFEICKLTWVVWLYRLRSRN
jgi:glycosyltransferase involved in cell wall biosynthesis